MAANILTHAHASAQEQYKPPTYIFKHFERILCKYARFSILPHRKTHKMMRNRLVAVQKTSD